MIFTMLKTWSLVAQLFQAGSNYEAVVLLQGITSKEECFRAATKMGISTFTCVETYTPIYKATIQD